MNHITTEENDRQSEQEALSPLTDEEMVKLKEKEKRTGGIISAIVDFITGFFQ